MPVEIQAGSRIQISLPLLRQMQQAIRDGSDHIVVDEAAIDTESGYVKIVASVEDAATARAWSDARAAELALAPEPGGPVEDL